MHNVDTCISLSAIQAGSEQWPLYTRQAFIMKRLARPLAAQATVSVARQRSHYRLASKLTLRQHAEQLSRSQQCVQRPAGRRSTNSCGRSLASEHPVRLPTSKTYATPTPRARASETVLLSVIVGHSSATSHFALHLLSCSGTNLPACARSNSYRSTSKPQS